MTAPAEALRHFLLACAIGSCLGAVYGFLRPLRPKWTGLSDLVFVAAAFWGWLVLCFGICRGDIRPGCTAGLFAGGLLWEWSIGRALRPVFSGFWKFVGRIQAILIRPGKKIWENAKNMFASAGKWVTIE